MNLNHLNRLMKNKKKFKVNQRMIMPPMKRKRTKLMERILRLSKKKKTQILQKKQMKMSLLSTLKRKIKKNHKIFRRKTRFLINVSVNFY